MERAYKNKKNEPSTDSPEKLSIEIIKFEF